MNRMSHLPQQQGHGIPLTQQQQQQQYQQQLHLGEEDLFSNYLGNNVGNEFNQALFVDTNQGQQPQQPDPLEFGNAAFYNNSPQYPTHFIPQAQNHGQPQQSQQQQQYVNLMGYSNNNTSAYQSLQGSFDGIPISGSNHQPRIYDTMNHSLQQQSYQPIHQQAQQFPNAQYHQQQQQQQQLQQQQILLQRQQQLQQQLHRQKQQQQLQQQQQQQQQKFHQSQHRPQQHQIMFQQQQSPIPSSKSQKRSGRNSKRKVKYDESSEDEDEVQELEDDEDETDLAMNEEVNNIG